VLGDYVLAKGKSDYDWMKEKLEIISKIGEKVKDNGPVTEYGNYTALKLISVYYYSEIFSGIVRHENQKSKGFDGAVYVDLFAGTGLVKLTDTGDFVGGSATCAASNKKGIDFCVCVEINKDKALALQKRLSVILPKDKFEVINGDCNNCINDVISSINKKFNKPILLTFVDPEGMEIKWNTLKTLSDQFFSCDFMINVSSSGSLRVGGKLKKGIENVKESFENYWGEDASVILREFVEGKTPEKKYQEMVKEILGRPIGENIPIRDTGNNIMYYLLGYTRMTSGGSQYASAFSTLNRRFRGIERSAVINILNQIKKRGTAGLDGFS